MTDGEVKVRTQSGTPGTAFSLSRDLTRSRSAVGHQGCWCASSAHANTCCVADVHCDHPTPPMHVHMQIFESGAIVLYLANAYGKLSQEEFAAAAQWTLFANSTLSEAFFNGAQR